MLVPQTQCNFWNKIKKKFAHLKHKKFKPIQKNNWIKHHTPHFGGFKGFNNKFKQIHNHVKNYFKALHNLKNQNKHHPKCPHLPHLPFIHKPIYPFMPVHKPLPPVHKPMLPPMIPENPQPIKDGVTEVHFFGQYTSAQPKTLLLANGKKVDTKEVTQVTLKVNFQVDNKLLLRMRNQFAKYHKKWMMTMGGMMGGFKAMMPYLKKHCKGRRFMKMKKFPKLMTRLVRLHEMIARHQALLHMLNQAHGNHVNIGLLEEKLKVMQKKFGFLTQKLKFLEEMNKVHDHKIGRDLVAKIIIRMDQEKRKVDESYERNEESA
jgi:hypothetical protein